MILRLLAEDGRISSTDISERLNISKHEVEDLITQLEDEGIIKGYHAMLDESVFPEKAVRAIIQVQTRPEREIGFDRIAKRIAKFSEVESLMLVSGGYDLQIVVNGKTLQDVASFVSSKLSSIDGVIATSTHFLLKKYKESGIRFDEDEDNERLQITP